MPVELNAVIERFPIAGKFVISRETRTEQIVVRVTLSDGVHRGEAECVPYKRYGETPEGVVSAILALRPAIAAGLTREALQSALPAGAARNGLDCALWDLEAKRSGRPAWQIAGLAAPQPLVTCYTLSLDTPQAMAKTAAASAHRPLLKIKLGAEGDAERISAIRAAAPHARLVVDANEGWSAGSLPALMDACAHAGVIMIEQPLPADEDAILEHIARPVPVCADESLHDRHDLARLRARYDAINIKLDKAGGLTEALALKAEAKAHGFGIMVGCMLATSLAMAPATLLAQGADVADLDGPLLLAADRPNALRYVGSTLFLPSPALWG